MSRALAAQVILLTELPEHLDQTSIPANGTRVSIHFGSANTSSLSAILFPVEGIPSGATHLPGLRRGSVAGKESNQMPQERSSSPRNRHGNEYFDDERVKSSHGNGDNEGVKGPTFRDDENQDDSDVGGDYATSGGSESPSGQDDSSNEDRFIDHDDVGHRTNSGRRHGGSREESEHRRNDGTRRRSDIPGSPSGRRPAANDARNGEDDRENDSSGRRGSNSQSNNRRRQPNEMRNQKPYGSRRTPWGYPTSGEIPYPQTKLPGVKPFVKATSEHDSSIAESDQAASTGESFRNIYKNKPFPKPDYRVRGNTPSPSSSFPAQTIIVQPDGIIRESVYPPIFDSAQSSTGYEIRTYDEETSEDSLRPQIVVLEADEDPLDARSALTSSSAGDYETVIEIPAVIPASDVSSSSSESRSMIQLKRPTTRIFAASSTNGYGGDEMDVVGDGDNDGGTAYVIRRSSMSDQRRPTVPTLIQLPGYKISFSDSHRARKTSN